MSLAPRRHCAAKTLHASQLESLLSLAAVFVVVSCRSSFVGSVMAAAGRLRPMSRSGKGKKVSKKKDKKVIEGCRKDVVVDRCCRPSITRAVHFFFVLMDTDTNWSSSMVGPFYVDRFRDANRCVYGLLKKKEYS